MTKVFLMTRENVVNLLVRGHAGKGKDEEFNMCCAGVSMLTNTALETAFRFMEEEKGKAFKYDSKDGYVFLELEANENHHQEIQMYHDFIRAGIDLLMARYPGRIIWGE